MTTINLKDYYPWYLTNEYIEVSDEVAAELRAGKLAEAAHAERVRYNKSYYSLDCDDGIEYSACVHEPSPQGLLERMDRFCHLWNALNSLPEIQGRRVDAHLILGKSYREIARDEGVDKSAVRNSVLCGIEAATIHRWTGWPPVPPSRSYPLCGSVTPNIAVLWQGKKMSAALPIL